MKNICFKDRTEAGLLLAEKLLKYKNTNSVILAIPRGGVRVGFELSKKLKLPLDLLLSKKIGHPANPEYAIGAITLNSKVIDPHPEVSKEYYDSEIQRLRKLIVEKYRLYRGSSDAISVRGKNVILVDDGIATGNTLLACIELLRKEDPLKIIIAVPVLPKSILSEFQQVTDELVYLYAPESFVGVGQFYENFSQVEDQEVINLMKSEHQIVNEL